MIRLGHIEYSNCVPVHAKLLETAPPGVQLVRDVPSRLNAALAAGTIDVAPCSSIEYARHAAEYAILPGLAIGSTGAVHSILLESAVAPEELTGMVVAIPTASATSVVLLRALLELRLGVAPQYTWFDQVETPAPAAAAVLRIGDVALNHRPRPGHCVYDLGAEWFDWTGLPFAFAVWQVRRDADPAEVRRLARALDESRAWFDLHRDRLALQYAAQFRTTADQLAEYWRSLRFDLDPSMERGLLHYYSLAAELGEAPRIDRLEILSLEPV